MNFKIDMYPLKFKPILKDKIWGGHKLEKIYHKNPEGLPNIGESWELSGYKNECSVVTNGAFQGKSLQELLSTYKEKFVGKKVYNKYQLQFPLLFKLIDANDDLSIQVHPNDYYARLRHNTFGKTEMWYVLQAEENAALIMGFKNDTKKEDYIKAVEDGTIENLLQKVPVKEGDVLFIHSGLVHAIGKGILVAEIQQSSDITYRIYDFKRKDAQGHERELHTKLAVDVIDYSALKNPKTDYRVNMNESSKLINCEYFTTNILEIDKRIEKDYSSLDSFVVYMCLEGKLEIQCNDDSIKIEKGETFLIPAELKKLTFIPEKNSKLLETYI